MAAPSPFDIIGLIGDIKELTEWLIRRIESFKQSATVYEKLKNVKNYHEGCINLQFDILNGIEIEAERRGRSGHPTDEHQQDTQKLLVEDLHSAFEAATDFLYRHWPRNTPARIMWSLKGEAGANTLLSQVEKAQSNLSVYLNLRFLRDGRAPNLRDPRDIADEFAVLLVPKPEDLPQAGGKMRVGKAQHKPRTALRVGEIWFLEEKMPISENSARITRSLELLAGPESLAFKIDAGERSAGLLPFIGYRSQDGRESLVFKLPDNTGIPQSQKKVPQLQTLQTFIRYNKFDSIPLDNRFRLARQLSEALGKVHAAGLAHRNIRSDNVVVLENVDRVPDVTEENGQGSALGGNLDEPPPESKASKEAASQMPRRSKSLVGSLRRRLSARRANEPEAKENPKTSDEAPQTGSRRNSLSGLQLRKKPSQSPADEPGGKHRSEKQNKQALAIAWPCDRYYIGAGHPSLFIMGWDCVARQGMPVAPLELSTDEVGRNIYQHPHVQSGAVVNGWNIGYDIYSLGVCLLEIGLWQAFTKPGPQSKMIPSSFLDKQVAEWNRDHPERQFPGQDGQHMRSLLQRIAKRSLRGRMGRPYYNFVVSCLTWLDNLKLEDAAADIIDEHLKFKEKLDGLFGQVNLGSGVV